MYETLIEAKTLPSAYHKALTQLYFYGSEVPCPDYDTTQKEISATIHITNPLEEPMISKLFIGGFRELEQYRQEMLDGILDFEIDRGNWNYTYHDRMVNYTSEHIDQIQFVINELKRNPSSRRAVILIRDASDIGSSEPACFTGTTLIYTPNGDRQIRDLKNGDTVYAYNFKKDIVEETKISNFFSRFSSTLTIRSDFGDITCDDNQLIYTNSGWKKATDIDKSKDKILYYGTYDNYYSFYHLVGCLCGDGWLSTPKKRYHTDGTKSGTATNIGISVHPKADDNAVYKLLSHFTHNTIRTREYLVNSQLVPTNSPSKKIEVCDKALFEKLSQYVPYGRKVTGTPFLLKAEDMDRTSIIDFLTGIYSSEGSIAKRGPKGHIISIGMCWKECIQEIEKMLTILGIDHSVYTTTNDKSRIYKIYVQNYEALRAFCESGICFKYDSRKQMRFLGLKKQYELMDRYSIKSIPTLSTDSNTNSMFVPIIDIKRNDTDTVYDFTVDSNDHAIIANGFVCHNCLQHIQFFIRNDAYNQPALHCKVLFRSNDACKAFFMNAFALILLQERIANTLGVAMGTYTHRANSFHCYARDYKLLEDYVTRIKNGGSNTYSYIDDWKDLMEECQPEIAAAVDKLYHQKKTVGFDPSPEVK